MKKILTLLMVFVAVLLKAQSGEISGKLVDENGEGLYPATVIIVDATGKNTSIGTTTDFDGNYSIKPLKPGSYDVKYSYIGYAAQIQKGVSVNADATRRLDVKLNPAANSMIEVEVVAYKIPLIEKGSTTMSSTLDATAIKNLPTQSVTDLASQTAGVYQEDANKGISIRGGREDATVYYVNGRKVIGKPNVPVQGVEQLTVITGGVPARYGDATGGVINITTKGPSADFQGGISFQTSQGLDAFGYNQANANLMGPIFSKGKGKDKKVILGFSTSFEFLGQKDRSPSALGVWQVKKSVLDDIKANPYFKNPNGTNLIFKSENLTFKDMYLTATKPNNAQQDYKGVLQFDLSPAKGIDFTFGGDMSYTKYHSQVQEYTLLNAENNPEIKELNYSVFGRFSHTVDLSGKKGKDGKEKSSAVQNFVYSLQFDYEKFKSVYADDNHKDKLFNYGYLGHFNSKKATNYSYTTQSIGGKNYEGWIQSGDPRDTSVVFTPGTENPLGSRFVEQYYELLGAQKNADGSYEVLGSNKYGFTESVDQILSGARLPNQRSEPIYNTWYNIGRQYNGYGIGNPNNSKDGNIDQYRARIEASFDVQGKGASNTNKHSIELGVEFDQRIQRTYSINPLFLWDVAKTNVNKHLQLDTSNPIFRINGVDYTQNDPARPQFFNTDTIKFGYTADAKNQGYFDKNLRARLGLGATDRIDIYNVDVDKLSIDLFSANELMSYFSGGSEIVTARGYDFTGKELKNNPSLKDFFNTKNSDGQYLRQQGAYKPIYASGYISDKFFFKDLGFLVGLRVDRFDANQYVLRDPYSLYDIKTKSEVATLDGKAVNHPSNIGDDYAVYVSKYGTGSQIIGYRKGDEWYDKYGNVSTGRNIASQSSEGALPYANLAGIDTMSTSTVKSYVQTNSDNYDPNSSFVKYTAKYTFMPRLQFSFNITDKAQFFAHYDILSQRPQSRNQLNLAEYLYWQENTGVKNNPNLKPETTIDYEFGFKQVVTKTSAITISAYYKEYRNLIQRRKMLYAFPATYTTYDNLDFVSTKGLNVIYDMRRTGNFKFNLNYTLQFAEGTGSDDGSQRFLVDADVPNYRTIFPVSFDARHQINATIDFHFAEGKDYNGPVVGNKQILANFGINLVLRARSGVPYSTSGVVADEGSIGGGTRGNTLSLNGPRLPWTFRADLRINKDFQVSVARKGEDKDPKKLYFSVYLWIQNLLNTKNIISVYRYTGNANDDGYLDAPNKQIDINSKYNAESYRDLYRARINDPNNYTLPRRIYLGASFTF
jgi:hypothetical protein